MTDTIHALTLTFYFFSAFSLSYIIPKAKIGKVFWYGLGIFFVFVFFHTLFMIMLEENMSPPTQYSSFLVGAISLIPVAGAFYDKRIWIGEEPQKKKTILPPSEREALEREKKLRF